VRVFGGNNGCEGLPQLPVRRQDGGYNGCDCLLD